MALEEIRNFHRLEGGLATAGQPTEAQLHEVAAAGFTHVINLAMPDHARALPDEAALVASLGMGYRNIAVPFDGPRIDDFAAFVTALDAAGTGPVLVHCAANYRVTAFMAVLGEMRLGWTRTQADALARRFWEPDPIWSAFLADCRARFIAPAPRSADR
jgi:protein tyrosine phosphatase (PTP) superfamily phosphohydrolase (DUF442 family)